MKRIKIDGFDMLLMIITAICTFLMLVTFEYSDCDTLTAWSVDIWDCIAKGNMANFCQYAVINSRGAVTQCFNGNFLAIIPIAIWNFPVWLTHMQGGSVTIGEPFCIFWSKLFFVVCTCVTGIFAYKICTYMNAGRKRALTAFILIIAAPELLISTQYAGQDEVVYLCTFMIALYFFVINKKTWFIIISMISVMLCPIMLMPYVALVLLIEKNIWKDLLYIVISFVPNLLFKLADTGKQFAVSDKIMDNFITGLLSTSVFESGYGEVSIIGVLLIMIYFWSYSHTCQDENDRVQSGFWNVSFILCMYNVLVWSEFYRLCVYIPTLAVLIMLNSQNFSMNMLLLNVLTYVRTLLCLSVNSPRTMNTHFVVYGNTVLINICQANGSDRFFRDIGLYDQIIEHFPVVMTLNTVIKSLAVGIMIILLIINHKRYTKTLTMRISDKVLILFYVLCMPLFLLAYYIVLFR